MQLLSKFTITILPYFFFEKSFYEAKYTLKIAKNPVLQYNRNMEQIITPPSLPRHLAIICDGNRRWAEKKNLPLQVGHYKGAGKIKDVIQWALDAKISELSLFVLSIDNFKRPQHEIDYLLQLPLEKMTDGFNFGFRQAMTLEIGNDATMFCLHVV